MSGAISDTLEAAGAAICEVVLDGKVPFSPKLGTKIWPDGHISSPPLEDLSPFLPRDIFLENMFIDVADN